MSDATTPMEPTPLGYLVIACLALLLCEVLY